MDSEAKLFEYAAKEKYPNVTVNVVSNKKESAEKNHNKPWKKRER